MSSSQTWNKLEEKVLWWRVSGNIRTMNSSKLMIKFNSWTKLQNLYSELKIFKELATCMNNLKWQGASCFMIENKMDLLQESSSIWDDFLRTPCPWEDLVLARLMKTHLFHACMLYAMLPDKKRDSYDTLFSMMKECLSRRGLSLSAQYLSTWIF